MYKILAINPGSTSTKIAVYHDAEPVFVNSIPHSAEDTARYLHVTEQYPMRKRVIEECLAAAGIPMDFDAVIGRGPLYKPVEGGAYKVTADMVRQAAEAEHQHACDLGCILAYEPGLRVRGRDQPHCRPRRGRRAYATRRASAARR